MNIAANGLLRLCFIRHGETEWSLSERHTGLTDLPLTRHGEEQARALASSLEQITFNRVLTSPLQRASRTCELAGLGALAEIDPDLSEWHYGAYEGRRSVDIRKERPGWNIFRDGCPEGEMPDDISRRVDRLLDRLHAIGGTIALFAHGQLGLVLAARWIGLAALDGQHFTLGPASISLLAHNPAHPQTRVVELWNASPTQLGAA